MRDGSPLDPYNENRTIHLDIIETDDITGDRSRSDTVEISTDTSIAEYWLDPRPTTSRISVTVSYMHALYSSYLHYRVMYHHWLDLNL